VTTANSHPSVFSALKFFDGVVVRNHVFHSGPSAA